MSVYGAEEDNPDAVTSAEDPATGEPMLAESDKFIVVAPLGEIMTVPAAYVTL